MNLHLGSDIYTPAVGASNYSEAHSSILNIFLGKVFVFFIDTLYIVLSLTVEKITCFMRYVWIYPDHRFCMNSHCNNLVKNGSSFSQEVFILV